MKKKMAFFVALILLITCLSGCAAKDTAGAVYYLNFKPEQDSQWQALAKKYTEKTGVKVTVLTAAEGQYEATLTSEMDKTNAPTLFQVNGPVGLASWKEYCYDLSDSRVYKELTDENFALKENGKVYGVAYVLETYGLIYNKALLQKYFDADWSSIKKAEDINNFKALSTVATEIQAHKDALGVDGAFASPGMDKSSDWRFKTHLANLPLYYEYKDDGIQTTQAVKGSYLDRYKAVWDLYINNTTCSKNELAGKTGTDAETEFKTGKAVFYQNGTWAYEACAYDEKTGEGLKDDQFGILPIYIGVDGEENQGLCTGSENYWCVNSKASEADREATLAFLEWLVTDEEGTKALADDMGFTIPFKSAKKAENPLNQIANDYVNQGKEPVAWVFSTMPSEDWKDGVGNALTQYAAGKTSWDSVKSAFVDGWKTEAEKAKK